MCNPNSSIYARRAGLTFGPRVPNQVQTSLDVTNNKLTQNILGSYLQQRSHDDSCAVPSAYEDRGLMDAITDSKISLFAPPTSSYNLLSHKNVEEATVIKPKPKKRRRKIQKPGKTAKMHDRHFVHHDYHDHALDHDTSDDTEEDEASKRRGGVSVSFPLKLHAVLDQVEMDGHAHIISWQPHGRCFVIHKPKEFVNHVMPHYFRQSKLTSFQRQLNLYGFNRLTTGNDSGGYYHELFLRGKPFLCKRMIRTKVKGTKFKAASSPEQEPNFYTMEPVVVTPPTTDCEASASSGDEQASSPSAPTIYRPVDAPPALPTSIYRPTSYTETLTRPTLPLPWPSSPAASMPVQQPQQQYQQERLGYFSPTRATASSSILDEAVEELFLQESLSGESDTIMDFVDTWYPNGNDGGNNLVDDSLESDVQLGYMLDRILGV